MNIRTKSIVPQGPLTKEKSYVLGVLGPGDGWVGKNQLQLGLKAIDRDFVEAFKKNIEKTYGIKSKIKIEEPKNKKHKRSFEVRLSSRRICEDVRKYKVPFKEKIWRVPSEIKQTNKNNKKAYIKGVFDSQAHVNIKKKEIRTVILNIFGLYELKSILTDLGIKSHISERVQRITIYRKENIEKYTNDIGFYIKRKQADLNKLLSSYKYK